MEPNLEELWSIFSLTEEEKTKVVVDKTWVEKTETARRNCLLRKIFTKHNINLEAMKAVLFNIWKLSHGLEVKEVGDKMYVFQFEDRSEKDKVLVRQPWLFNKALIVLAEFDGFSSLEDVNMDWCLFLGSSSWLAIEFDK